MELQAYAGVVALYVENDESLPCWYIELALQKHPKNFKNGNWVLPGGRVESGEEPIDAAYREFREEKGVPLPPGSLSYERSIKLYGENGHKKWFFLYVSEGPYTPCDPKHITDKVIVKTRLFPLRSLPTGRSFDEEMHIRPPHFEAVIKLFRHMHKKGDPRTGDWLDQLRYHLQRFSIEKADRKKR